MFLFSAVTASPLLAQAPEGLTVGGNMHVNYFYNANQPADQLSPNRGV